MDIFRYELAGLKFLSRFFYAEKPAARFLHQFAVEFGKQKTPNGGKSTHVLFPTVRSRGQIDSILIKSFSRQARLYFRNLPHTSTRRTAPFGHCSAGRPRPPDRRPGRSPAA